LPAFVAPIRAGQADYTKGNRFFDPEHVRKMPRMRLLGNAVLSFMSKASSGTGTSRPDQRLPPSAARRLLPTRSPTASSSRATCFSAWAPSAPWSRTSRWWRSIRQPPAERRTSYSARTREPS
jgi:hypothetical protein